MILESGVAKRAKVQDMSTLQRCYSACQSKVDVEESFRLGMSAHMHSMDPTFTGKMVAVKRPEEGPYNPIFCTVDAKDVANFVKHVPAEWILDNYQGVTQEFYDYCTPLIQGEPDVIMDNGTIAQIEPFYL